MVQTEFNFTQTQHNKNFIVPDAEYADKYYSEYVYGKYIDMFLDVLPYRLGWRMIKWPSEIRWWFKNKYQKIRYGVCDDEVYNLNCTIAKFIVPRLKYFKKKGKVGIPIVLLPDDYNNVDDDQKELYEIKAEKEFSDALDEMIFAFEYEIDPDSFCEMPDILMHNIGKLDFNRKETEEEKQAWNDYVKKSEELNARKENGLKLFAKYFNNLWI